MRSFAVVAAFASVVFAADSGPNEPLNPNPTDTNNPRLVGKAFPFDHLPYQVDTSKPRVPNDPNYRGAQSGYNQCNSTTEGPNSKCQTLVMNSIDDFCLWGPSEPNSLVGDAEGEMVIWCTKPGHGGRLIPPGALTAVQFLKAPSYVAVTGHIDQTKINIRAGDDGGELDSGGQDQRGNPIGAVAYSKTMGSAHGVLTQSRTWHAFMGSNIFCQKLCDPKAPNAAGLCRHTLDTLGCEINVPAAYEENVFLSCASDDQKPVQEGVSDIPKSSACTTYTSALIYGTNAVSASTTSSATSTGTPPASSAPAPPASQTPPTSAPTPPKSGGAIPPTQPSGGSQPPASPSPSAPGGGNGASSVRVGFAATVLALAFGAVLA